MFPGQVLLTTGDTQDSLCVGQFDVFILVGHNKRLGTVLAHQGRLVIVTWRFVLVHQHTGGERAWSPVSSFSISEAAHTGAFAVECSRDPELGSSASFATSLAAPSLYSQQDAPLRQTTTSQQGVLDSGPAQRLLSIPSTDHAAARPVHLLYGDRSRLDLEVYVVVETVVSSARDARGGGRPVFDGVPRGYAAMDVGLFAR